MAKETNNRWWEFYLVRYFVGTVIGTLIILVLTYHPNSSIGSLVNFKEFMGGSEKFNFEMSYLWLFGLIGLAYCYLSSAPILVLHAYRSSIFYNSKSFLDSLKFLIILVIAALIFIYFIRVNYHWFLLAIVIISQIYMVAYDMFQPQVFQSYKNLTGARAKESNQLQQYVESYRHLREHGNAFIILLMEIVFAIILFNVRSYFELVVVIVIWILPACTAWFVGCYLESKLQRI